MSSPEETGELVFNMHTKLLFYYFKKSDKLFSRRLCALILFWDFGPKWITYYVMTGT